MAKKKRKGQFDPTWVGSEEFFEHLEKISSVFGLQQVPIWDQETKEVLEVVEAKIEDDEETRLEKIDSSKKK